MTKFSSVNDVERKRRAVPQNRRTPQLTHIFPLRPPIPSLSQLPLNLKSLSVTIVARRPARTVKLLSFEVLLDPQALLDLVVREDVRVKEVNLERLDQPDLSAPRVPPDLVELPAQPDQPDQPAQLDLVVRGERRVKTVAIQPLPPPVPAHVFSPTVKKSSSSVMTRKENAGNPNPMR
jgi:hypothetical protein